jgi:hypothetical protein
MLMDIEDGVSSLVDSSDTQRIRGHEVRATINILYVWAHTRPARGSSTHYKWIFLFTRKPRETIFLEEKKRAKTKQDPGQSFIGRRKRERVALVLSKPADLSHKKKKRRKRKL